MHRALRITSVTLITAGLIILMDAGITLAWQEPLSALYSEMRQNAAAGELESVEEDFAGSPEVERALRDQELAGASPEQGARDLARIFASDVENGESIGRILIPSIDASYVVVEGTEEADLQRGPGRYEYTGLPGEGRTIGIAGHRTTYGAPFNRINEIDRGDQVILEMPYGDFTYRVTRTDIVDPSDVGIVDDTGRERLVLTACHPLYSAAQRYAVFADLERAEPAGPDP